MELDSFLLRKRKFGTRQIFYSGYPWEIKVSMSPEYGKTFFYKSYECGCIHGNSKTKNAEISNFIFEDYTEKRGSSPILTKLSF